MPWPVVLLIVLAVFTLPFVVAGYLARQFRMPDYGWKIGLILWSVACGVVIVTLGWPPKLGIDLSGGVVLVYEVDQEKKLPDQTVDMDKLIAAVSQRVNPGGVKEVTIREYGVEQIEIIIPEVDVDEARRIEKLVSRAGTLEFRILANTRDHKDLIDRANRETNTRLLKDSSSGEVLARWVPLLEGEKPEDQERVERIRSYAEIATRKIERGKRTGWEVLVVVDDFDVTGGYLTEARSGVDQRGNPCVNFTFNSVGGQLFGGLTGNNLPDTVADFYRKLGIILDGRLYSAPRINSTIFANGEISGSFTNEEVQDLVNVLNAGALPTALSEEPISRLETGPTLGRDTIVKGSWAIGTSMVLVLLFMLVYYRFAGIVACGALLMNLLLILGIMIAIKAAFTLPGLAGLVLTVGMAVDANVLIFERIREEVARGAALRMAIRNGFAKATTTIVDANLTTLITATVLYVIGTDQVKGFAVTLWLGVVLSMYTAIFCSRVVFDVAERRRWISSLTMMRILGGTQIDFLGMRRVAGAVSIVVIVIGLVGVGVRGVGLLDIDFTGGSRVQILFNDAQPIADVRASLSELPDLAVSDVQITGEEQGLRFVIDTSQRDLDTVLGKLADVFGSKLAANSVTFGDARPVTPAARAEPEAGGAKEDEPAEPEAAEQSRHDLPNDSVLAMGEPFPLLLAEAAADPDAEPTTQPAAPQESPPPDAAAGEPSADWTEAQVTFGHAVNHDTLWESMAKGFEAAGHDPAKVDFELSNPGYFVGESKAFTTWNVKIKMLPEEATAVFDSVQATIESAPFFPSSNNIGGKVAGSTRTLAITALLTSLLFIVGYIWIRFQRVMFGLAAVVALVHDVLVTLGMIALSAFVAPYLGVLLIDPFKIGLPALAAFLTIIGYSLNDTIVVFDRIREVRGKAPRLTREIVNTSINQTLSRTLLTSATTLLVVLILYMFGGHGIHGFAFALVVGVLVGTYSSIFVASPALYWMSRPSGAK